MAPKRPRSDEAAGPSRKEQRIAQVRDARRIDVGRATQQQQQQQQQHGHKGNTSSSSSAPAADALPPQLSVESALSSRRFEISALQRAIRASRAAASTRAWQLLPRHARRRAASHNLLRLPSRLRAKGAAELRASSTTPKTRAQIRKRAAGWPVRSKGLARKQELMGRAQRDGRRWLETHLWLAKRFRMSVPGNDADRWGFVLPEAASFKGKKTDWRAAKERCVVFDASWEQWVRVSCKVPKSETGKAVGASRSHEGATASGSFRAQHLLEEVLSLARLCRIGPGGRISLTSGTCIDAVLHTGNPGPSDKALCPVVLYVAPPPRVAAADESGGERQRAAAGKVESEGQSKREGEGQPKRGRVGPAKTCATSRNLKKQLAMLPPTPPLSETNPDFEVLLRVHPAARVDLERAVKKAIAKVVQAGKKPADPRNSNSSSTSSGGNSTGTGTGTGTDTSTSSEGVHFVVQHLHGPDASVAVGWDGAKDSGPGRRATPGRHHGRHGSTSTSAGTGTKVEKDLELRLAALRRNTLRQRAFSVFELVGPLAGAVLGGVLRPDPASTDAEQWATWRTISRQRTRIADRCEERIVLPLQVYDPRLAQSFRPIKIHKLKAGEGESDQNQGAPGSAVHGSNARQHLLRDSKDAPRFTKGDIDRRRAKLLVPGSPLQPTSDDDIVPVIVVQRYSAAAQAVPAKEFAGFAGFTLLVPQTWSRPFFHALIAASARPLSLSSMRLLHLEAGLPSYPCDWIGSPGWAEQASFDGQKRKDLWQRRPKGKRTEWQKVGTRWPFGGAGMWKECVDAGRRALWSGIAGNSDGASSLQSTVKAQRQRPCCHANSTAVHLMGSAQLLDAQIDALAAFLTSWRVSLESSTADASDAQRRLTPSWERLTKLVSPSGCVVSNPFVLVRLRAIGRGAFEDGAEIHLPLPEDEDEDDQRATSSPTATQPAQRGAQVGSVTSGGYSLSRGVGWAIGAVSREAWVWAVASARARGSDSGGVGVQGAVLVVRRRSGGPRRLAACVRVFP